MDRDQVAMQHIINTDKLYSVDNVPKNIIPTNNILHNKNLESNLDGIYDLALIMLPSWGIFFPPYNLAKLTGHLRANNFNVYVNDINIKAYHLLKNTINSDAFDGDKYWKWQDEKLFYNLLFSDLENLFETEAEIIANLKTDVIGFTMYQTNKTSVKWFVNYLKFHCPEKIIIIGGPEIYYRIPDFGDYIFKGEGEESLASFLVSKPKKPEKQIQIGQWFTKKQNLDLNKVGWPDYSDYDFSLYSHANGISSEVSRGCIAKCSFCTETHFWKYRYRTPYDIVKEIEAQKKLYNLKRVWFVDSLVNGNIKQLEEFSEIMSSKNLDIAWNGYARCNDRMDRNYFQKLVDSGCDGLSFGVESGSDKILEVMNKKIEVKYVFENIKNAATVKSPKGKPINIHINWIVGYPKEEKIDQLQSLALLYNIRKYADGISPGATAGQSPGAYLGDNPEDYNISKNVRLYNDWADKDFIVTKPHRLVRLICTVTLLDIMQKYLPQNKLKNYQHRQELDTKWNLNYDNFINKEFLNINKSLDLNFLNQGTLTNKDFNWNNTITNEWLTFFYFLHLLFDNYEFTYKMSEQEILEAFGYFIAVPYQMDIKVTNSKNKLKIDISHSLNSKADNIQTKFYPTDKNNYNIFNTNNTYEFEFN